MLFNFAIGRIISPATTMLSLLASKIVLPVCAAIKVVSNPANPDIAEIITSIFLLLSKFSSSDFSLIISTSYELFSKDLRFFKFSFASEYI